jgi:8-oxo-dGTP pyrophosphatase MutT (NUDIX family)
MVIYKSASITWIWHNKTLLCREYRHGKLLIHPIGGKYEDHDGDISHTAIREFLEESNILQNPDFQLLLLPHQSATEYFTTYVIPKAQFYDYCVNQTHQYYHRYYIVELEEMEKTFQQILKNAHTWYQKRDSECIEELIWNRGFYFNKKKHSQLSFYLLSFLKEKRITKETKETKESFI